MYASSVLWWYEVLSVSCEPALRDGVVRACNTWEERDTPPTLQEGSFFRISNTVVYINETTIYVTKTCLPGKAPSLFLGRHLKCLPAT